MSKNRADRDNLAERDRLAQFRASGGPADVSADRSLALVAEQLEWLRTVSDDVLGSAIVRAGSCMNELVDGDRPGWLFDDTTDRGSAALVCAECPVRGECLELELRLFGAEKLGMWGALGEDGRRALHPVWLQARDDATDADGTGRGGDR